MNHSAKFFLFCDCEYYPCHACNTQINCLFCYCPCYLLDDCPGDPDFSIGIKDCSKCDYPHKAENYYNIVDYLIKKTVERKRSM